MLVRFYTKGGAWPSAHASAAIKAQASLAMHTAVLIICSQYMGMPGQHS